MSFSATGQYLTTDRGILSLSSSTSPNSLGSPCVLSVAGDWITEKGDAILWLPAYYGADRVAVWNELIVVGHVYAGAKGLSFLYFTDGLKTV